jgi:hypothetical protein
MDRVVLLTSEGENAEIAARYLAARFANFAVIIEQPQDRVTFLRKRLTRLGAVTVAGQIAFMIFQRFQQHLMRSRIADILAGFGGEPPLSEQTPVIRVTSVNTDACMEALRQLDPAVVLVVGTRIISGAVLRCVHAQFINYHAGITPKYRGVHGGYWALAEGDGENFGSTIHLVDEGIDSGDILYQTRIAPLPVDDFSTYPYLQLGAALPMLVEAARDALASRTKPQPVNLPSRLWSHPTLWTYLANGFRRGVL